MTLVPAVCAVEIAVAADAAEDRVVVADYAPCLDVFVGGSGGRGF